MCKACRQRSIWARIKLYSSILNYSSKELKRTWNLHFVFYIYFAWVLAFLRKLFLNLVSRAHHPKTVQQTPTLIGCMFLMIRFPRKLLAAISEVRYYNTVFAALKSFFEFLQNPLKTLAANSSKRLHQQRSPPLWHKFWLLCKTSEKFLKTPPKPY